MAESPKNISIAVYEQNKEKIKNADNSSEEFIIQMNEFLQNINNKNLISIEEYKKNIEDLENENDKQEKSITYMRGLLQNFNVKIKTLTSLIKYDKEYFKNTDNYINIINNLLKKLHKNIIYYQFIFSIFLIISYICDIISFSNIFTFIFINYISISLSCIISGIDINFIINIFDFINKFNKTQKEYNFKIKTFDDEIKTIDKSNDYIEDYINVI